MKLSEEIFTVNKPKFMAAVIVCCALIIGCIELIKSYPAHREEAIRKMTDLGLVKRESSHKKVIDIHIPTGDDFKHIHTPKPPPKNPKSDKDKAKQIRESV